MKASLQKLQKFFRLEAERGYDNHAVLGGLDRMLDRWEAEARAEAVPEDLIQLVVARIRDYPRLSPTSRAETLEGLMRRIQRVEESSAAPRPVSRQAEKKPVEFSTPPAHQESVSHLVSEAETPPLEKPSEERLAPTSVDSVQTPVPTEVERKLEEKLPQVVKRESVVVEKRSQPPPSTEPASEEDTELLEGEWSDTLPLEEEPAPLPPRRIPETAVAPDPAALRAPITVLSGVGAHHAQTLAKLGLTTLRDLLYYFPRRYDDYSKLKPINRLWYGEEVTVIGTVQSVHVRSVRGGTFHIVEAVVSDGSGALRVSWFNQAWIAKRLRGQAHIVLSGKVDQYLGRLVMNSPEWEPLEQQQLNTNRIVPVYPLTANVTQKWLRRLMNQVVTYWAPRIPDPLPADLRRSAGLMDLPNALLQAHFPNSEADLRAARQRLAFDEIFLLQLGVLRQKRAWNERSAAAFTVSDSWLELQLDSLPFPLTAAQQRAMQDVRQDLASGRPMNRLLQGDVGSGKTVVAAMACAMVIQEGGQAAFMAPTSILAEQHYMSLLKLFTEKRALRPAEVEEHSIEETSAAGEPEVLSDQGVPEEPGVSDVRGSVEEQAAAEVAAEAAQQTLSTEPATVEEQAISTGAEDDLPDDEPVAGIDDRLEVIPQAEETVQIEPLLHPEEIRLMIGSTPEAEKQDIRLGLANGSIKLVIGTHALIEDPVTFSNLQLVIVDEQHRFGVEQRAALRSKGTNPHLLVMTATPIPRSLALTVYGDLELSVMDEMPPGRQPVSTYVVTPRERERAYTLIRRQIENGHQAFVIYPLVEESDKSDSMAAVEEHARLKKDIFPKLKLGLLHGRMKPDEKDEVMTRFRDGDYQVLVSTSVVEVGVDVPNATVMLIEGANRFGLAQLHQFRGRVGRSAEKSYCLLIPETPDAVENERLQVMAETNDGFVLAERDLDQRGPGQFLGTRQSGYSELQLAKLTDVHLIEKARHFAQILFAQDPDLSRPEHQNLASSLQRFWGDGKGDIS